MAEYVKQVRTVSRLLNKVEYAQVCMITTENNWKLLKVVQQVSDLKTDLENQKADLETQRVTWRHRKHPGKSAGRSAEPAGRLTGTDG